MGRRVKPGEERRNPINVRIRDSLRARLEEAGKLSSRTLSHEVEERLERSFDAQDTIMGVFKDAKTLSLASAIASTWHVIGMASEEHWSADPETLALAREATGIVMSMVRPVNDTERPSESSPKSLSGIGNDLIDSQTIASMAAYAAVCMARGKAPAQERMDELWAASARYFREDKRPDCR